MYVRRIGRKQAPARWDYYALVAAGEVWVADSGGRIVGVLVLRPVDGGLQLDHVAVAPAEQRQGIGHSLIAFAEQQALARGLSAVTLYTDQRLEASQWLHAALGYEVTLRRTEDGLSRAYFRKPSQNHDRESVSSSLCPLTER